ncbi:4'-phosphopantetheinyl transferase family protein [Blattabacterium cuenoti]|uniref:4'-phosphopantetheinyl transferase family protein n=1 Tax=Blattabacterium cuenoti TaxID=1653831 RepID=UPI00163D1479|nr:4'-phosphopantetheinyl transferase superfamily protein [Blattabacterium cuenoti]
MIKFHTKIFIIKWKHFSESILLKEINLSKKEKLFFFTLKKKRKKEFLGIIYVIKHIMGIKNFFYNKKKPFLKGRKEYVSFSHSFERMAIAISLYRIGIDIEKLREDKKIVKIKNRFIRNDESIFIDPNYEEDYLHIIWGIKESLYKLEGGIFYSFLDHYKVSPFCMENDTYISCWIIKEFYSKKFFAFYRKIENHYLVYIIDNIEKKC